MKKPNYKTFALSLGLVGSAALALHFGFAPDKSTAPAPSPAPVAAPQVVKDPGIIAFQSVPLSAVATYLQDTYQYTLLTGDHGDVVITLTGAFKNAHQVIKALRPVLSDKKLSLSGYPLAVHSVPADPVFHRVDWGSSNGQIYILYGNKVYPVAQFPYLLRRDQLGNFQAAVPSAPASYPAAAGSEAGAVDSGKTVSTKG